MNAKLLVAKASIACIAIAGLVAVAGADLYPTVPTVKVLAYAGGAMLIVLALAALAIVVGQQWHLFGLNRGGTDPKWMWFGGEPPGLLQERTRSERQSRNEG
jgi:hypothetical protein